jgi:hypothetical protein
MTEPTPTPTPTPPTPPPTPTRRDCKRERKLTAQILPPGITHNMMKKYVVYYREMIYRKDGKQQPREYFKVEAHPKLNKPWITSKSVKIPLLEKLKEANQVVDDLDAAATTTATAANTANAIAYPPDITLSTALIDRWNSRLPKYTTMRIVRDTHESSILSVNYDRKDNLNGFRWTGSHTFSLPSSVSGVDTDTDADAVISLEIQKLRDKLIHKYGFDLWGV